MFTEIDSIMVIFSFLEMHSENQKNFNSLTFSWNKSHPRKKRSKRILGSYMTQVLSENVYTTFFLNVMV